MCATPQTPDVKLQVGLEMRAAAKTVSSTQTLKKASVILSKTKTQPRQTGSDRSTDEIIIGMTLDEVIQFITETTIVGGTFYIASMEDEGKAIFLLKECIKRMVVCALVHSIWYYTDFHKHIGVWKTSEPRTHFIFTLKTMWIVFLYMLGKYATEKFLCIKATTLEFIVLYQITEEHIGERLASLLRCGENNSTMKDALLAVIIFYLLDLGRYVGHRIGHAESVWYRKFPWAHAHHHNQVFMDPLLNFMSPYVHFAAIGTYVPCGVFAAFGYERAARWAWVASIFPTLTQHMGADPLPWLTRINHYYFYGALPWISLYHSYHHLHIVKSGNFGNTSCLWDYVFGTVTPESIYHIEHGEPTPRIKKFFADADKLERHFVKNLANKNRIDLS
mmetsp:Transcript_38182/g.44474  ORF Transcript_38182/g.44474 Transcript_38182/m.44474 type:complete len:390 (+) Transcript_38182:142-1311(+)